MGGDRWHISSTLVVPGNWSHRVGTRKLGSMRRLVRLIKCREVGGDPERVGFYGLEVDLESPLMAWAPHRPPQSPPLFTNTEQSWAGPEKGLE